MKSEKIYSAEEFMKNFGDEETKSENNATAKDEISHSTAFDYRNNITNAADLLSMEFPEPKYAVDGILPEGLTILVGKPKLGKTWLALATAVAVAAGGRALGKIPVEEGDALYLCLEDGNRRLQQRLKVILNGSQQPKRLDTAAKWRRFDEGGLYDIEEWLKDHSDARLIVIDTLKRVRPPQQRGGRLYDDDYNAVCELADLAKQYGVAVVVVHHTRKQESDDPLELVSGSNGLTGAADGILVLKRSMRGSKDAELFATGRDFEDKELALQWDKTTCQWISIGDAEDYRLSQERQEIIDLLRNENTSMSPKEIAVALNRNHGAVRKLLIDMNKAGQVRSDGRGRYSLPSKFGNISNNGNSGNKEGNGLGLFDKHSSVTDVTNVTNFSLEDDRNTDYEQFPF